MAYRNKTSSYYCKETDTKSCNSKIKEIRALMINRCDNILRFWNCALFTLTFKVSLDSSNENVVPSSSINASDADCCRHHKIRCEMWYFFVLVFLFEKHNDCSSCHNMDIMTDIILLIHPTAPCIQYLLCSFFPFKIC